MTLDKKYLPTAIVLPYEGHARQSKALSISGLNGVEKIAKYANSITEENVDFNEALAAKKLNAPLKMVYRSMKVNQYIKKAIDERMERDNSDKETS